MATKPAKSRSVAHLFGLLLGRSPRANRVAEEPLRDWPPPSDCWPCDVVAADRDVHARAALLLGRGGMAITAEGVREVEAMLLEVRGALGLVREFPFHGRDDAAKRTALSPGKAAGITGR